MYIYGIIYITINKVNNKKYIGQHVTRELKDNYLGSGTILKKAINKYGIENFERRIVDVAFSKQELDIKERCWISYFNAVSSDDYYNIHIGGSGGDTFSGKDEYEKKIFKLKMKEITKGENNGMYGKRHSNETKLKISEARLLKDYPYFKSEEFKNKMSIVTKGKNNGMYGRNHSDKTKLKISELNKGKCAGKNNGMYGKKDENAINGKKVYQYLDKNMTILINTFNTVGCALKYLDIKGHAGLNKAIKNKSEYKNYYWSKKKKV